MKKVIGIMLMLLMIKCISPLNHNGPVQIPCESAVLVLNTVGIDTTAWREANKGYTFKIKATRIDVTLSSIPEAALPAWLYQYNANVEFDESKNAILCHHFIPNINSFQLEKVSKTINFNQLQDSLVKKGLPLKESFQLYVELSFNRKNELTVNGSDAFKPNKQFYYPMAFFTVVEQYYGKPESILLTFHKGTYRGNRVIVIEVKSGTFHNYYDFAQYPPLR